jgi:uncharacterized membrane protein YedE/YeeE
MNTENKDTGKKVNFALNRENFILLGIGMAIIILGFILMAGGESTDPKVFSEEMFSHRRITIAPLLILGGFTFQVYAIMKKPKN